MKKLPWILIVLLAILSGCATPENIDRNVQIDNSNGLHQMQNRMDSLLYNMQLTQEETNEKLSNLQLENKTVYLSVPDSIGRQYPTSVSQTTVNKEEKEHKTSDMRIEATLKQLITEVDELRQQFNATTLKNEKVEEVSWWQLHKVDMYIIVLGFIIGLKICKAEKK
ncbi:histidine kinase [Bacteroides uniformis]|uniref:histidine kinase n=1 Tax=Bacteroides uniformis TaxID=820 RepID=UPI00319E5B3F